MSRSRGQYGKEEALGRYSPHLGQTNAMLSPPDQRFGRRLPREQIPLCECKTVVRSNPLRFAQKPCFLSTRKPQILRP